uniref:Uncharacterized protein n=1 Tax=Knipowitschia caucasica TaxID=637954 RepID=A0AAV2JN90_KNICA
MCNFTVTCSSGLSEGAVSRSFSCVTNSCDQSDTHSPGHTDSSIALFLSGSSIICNHSNHVSWSQDTWDYQQECEKKGIKDDKPAVIRFIIFGVVTFVVALVLVYLFFDLKRRKRMKRENLEETVYDDVQVKIYLS